MFCQKISNPTRRFLWLYLLVISGLLAVSGCGSHVWHHVQRGDTLYSISFRYGQDYKQLAQWNNIEAPYIISLGQRLRVSPPQGSVVNPLGQNAQSISAVTVTESRPVAANDNARIAPRIISRIEAEKKPRPSTTIKTEPRIIIKSPPSPHYSKKIVWQWPVKGKIIKKFSIRQPGSKGIDITNRAGIKIKAAASGRVVYAGDGLVSYGRLIIIKHNERFLSAYAHNERLLVEEGQDVKAGQAIATMGNSGTDRVKLHFEVREKGKPVNPLKYLPH